MARITNSKHKTHKLNTLKSNLNTLNGTLTLTHETKFCISTLTQNTRAILSLISIVTITPPYFSSYKCKITTLHRNYCTTILLFMTMGLQNKQETSKCTKSLVGLNKSLPPIHEEKSSLVHFWVPFCTPL